MIAYRQNTFSPLMTKPEPEVVRLPLTKEESLQRSVCPCCGYNLEKQKSVDFGEWHWNPDDQHIYYKGKFVRGLTKCETMFAGAILAAKGKTVRLLALCQIMGCDPEVSNIVNVYKCKAGKKFEEAVRYSPIRNEWGVGYFWAAFPDDFSTSS